MVKDRSMVTKPQPLTEKDLDKKIKVLRDDLVDLIGKKIDLGRLELIRLIDKNNKMIQGNSEMIKKNGANIAKNSEKLDRVLKILDGLAGSFRKFDEEQ